MDEKKQHLLENLAEIRQNIEIAAKKSGRTADEITLLAATKTVSPELINFAIENGVDFIGENRVQEMLSKDDDILPSAHRHFIGHLQTNKVKDIICRVEMIESVHSLKLAAEISKQAVKAQKTMDILLEVNIGNEESKSGFLKEETEKAVEEISKMDAVCIKGLMCIPPICENPEKNREYFAQMRKLFIDIGAKKSDNVNMKFLSMGMSADYAEAIEEGANIVRIGTALFGSRNYTK